MTGGTLLVLMALAAGRNSDASASDLQWGEATENTSTVFVTAGDAASSVAPGAMHRGVSSSSCWYEPDPSYGPPPKSAGGSAGSWYRWRCSDDVNPQNVARIPRNDLERWLPKPAVTPRDVAQEAVKAIHLSAPSPHMSPDAALQWANFPTFLWTDRATWHPLSATASVPGLAVSATATPVRLTWEMGDGSIVNCTGPGTPFTDATPASSSSPDCGHVYRRSSDSEPSGKFTVQATETWHVTWVGGGESGELPDMTATTSIPVRVAESQALVASVR